MVWTMVSIFHGLRSMVHFGHHFPRKNVLSIVFYCTSVPSRSSLVKPLAFFIGQTLSCPNTHVSAHWNTRIGYVRFSTDRSVLRIRKIIFVLDRRLEKSFFWPLFEKNFLCRPKNHRKSHPKSQASKESSQAKSQAKSNKNRSKFQNSSARGKNRFLEKPFWE